jgi:carbonic anhydrase
LPKNVAAAIIEDHLKPLIHDIHPLKATDRQIGFLKELEHSGKLENISASVASAWIEHHLDALNLQALYDMKLKAGDAVALISDVIDLATGEIRPDPRIRIISSIDRRGRVHFLGGGGQGAWPSQLVAVNDTQID